MNLGQIILATWLLPVLVNAAICLIKELNAEIARLKAEMEFKDEWNTKHVTVQTHQQVVERLFGEVSVDQMTLDHYAKSGPGFIDSVKRDILRRIAVEGLDKFVVWEEYETYDNHYPRTIFRGTLQVVKPLRDEYYGHTPRRPYSRNSI